MTILGRLKTISYAEIFVILVVVFLTVFMVKFFGRKKEFKTIRVEVIRNNWTENYDPYGYRAPFWLSDKVKVGQTEKSKSGKIIATLTDLENYERGSEEAELYLTVKIETLLNKRTGVYTFKDKPINLGSSIELNLDNISIVGQIVDNNVPEGGYPAKYLMVTAKGRNFESWLYTKVVPGLKVYNRATNEVVAEVVDVKLENSTLQQIKYSSSYLQAIVGKDKDLLVYVKVKVYQMDGRWYFMGHQNIKIAGSLYLYTNELNLYGFEIEDIKELP